MIRRRPIHRRLSAAVLPQQVRIGRGVHLDGDLDDFRLGRRRERRTEDLFHDEMRRQPLALAADLPNVRRRMTRVVGFIGLYFCSVEAGVGVRNAKSSRSASTLLQSTFLSWKALLRASKHRLSRAQLWPSRH